MFPNILPLRAIAFQSLFLMMAIAIEATVLFRQLNPAAERNNSALMRLSPKQSIQYAATANLLSVVVGWSVFFLFFGVTKALPPDVKISLMNFIFFDQWSGETATLLIMVCFLTFFGSFAVKQLGLVGLQRLLNDKKESTASTAPLVAPEMPALNSPAHTSAIRDLRREPHEANPQIGTLLLANAWSYSAILVSLLIIRLFLQINF